MSHACWKIWSSLLKTLEFEFEKSLHYDSDVFLVALQCDGADSIFSLIYVFTYIVRSGYITLCVCEGVCTFDS